MSDLAVTPVPPLPPPDPDALVAQYKRHWTPLGNGERMLTLYKDALRYVIDTGTWLVWANGRWLQDIGSVRVHHLAKATLKHMLLHPDVSPVMLDDYKKWIKKSETEAMIEQMLALTRSDRSIAVSVVQLDQHPDLLCCANGVIDLRNGQLQPNRPDLYLSRNANVVFDPDAMLLQWDRFLNDVTNGNQHVRDFLQLAVGYSLQGSCREEKFFILHGPGRTGKSTLIEAISGALGDYHVATNFSTFVRKDRISSGPSEDVARLAGARFVTASEVDDGQRFAEATVKQLTGGDAVAARFLYQNSFTYRPQFKLWLAVNHLPFMATDDSAIWRRLIRIPCEHQPAKPETGLKAMFATPEAKAAILAWAVKGAVRWYQTGLAVPDEVQTANATAREEMDPTSAFLTEECLIGPAMVNTVSQLRTKYDEWAANNGQRFVLDRRRFNRALQVRGFTQSVRKLHDNRKHRCWIGLQWVGDDVDVRERIEAELHRKSVERLFSEDENQVPCT